VLFGRDQWLQNVFSVVEPEAVRWIFLSHDDHDHLGNLDPVLDLCQNATLLANYAMVGRLFGDVELPLERMRWINVGESIDVGDRELLMVRPPMFDSPGPAVCSTRTPECCGRATASARRSRARCTAGQNLGTLSDLSGTVGAAKMAATRGIPAVAFSQGLGDSPQYDSTGKLALQWLSKHRAAVAKKPKTAPTTIDNYNVPNCPSGKSRGVLVVTTAPDANNAVATVDCTATSPKPTTDIEAFNEGYAALATVPAA
jgi:Survival protein SurE